MQHEVGRAQSAPPSRVVSVEDLERQLQERLQIFGLSTISDFSIVVEGTTDRDYLMIARDRARSRHGIDLLALPPGVRRETAAEIGIYTPVTGGGQRGGASGVVALAQKLAEFCLTLNFFHGLVFVFDYDGEGKECCNRIGKMGYPVDRHTVLLEPAQHPRVPPREDMLMEDLLSLEVQKAFFNRGDSWCSVEYQRGHIVGFRWHNKSKPALREFVRATAQWEDVVEVARLISRIRRIWGFGDDPDIFTI